MKVFDFLHLARQSQENFSFISLFSFSIVFFFRVFSILSKPFLSRDLSFCSSNLILTHIVYYS
eukprot:m.6111 g.6111  ORF g.6111 m.6111 type:complete len:63 (-) comp4696_c0_seq1:87-275(-)